MRQYLNWLLILLPIAAECGDVLWSGIFNVSATVDDFDLCTLAFLSRLAKLHSSGHRRVMVKSNCPLAVVHPWHRIHGRVPRTFPRVQESCRHQRRSGHPHHHRMYSTTESLPTKASQFTGWHVFLEWPNDGAQRVDPSDLRGPGERTFVLSLFNDDQ